MKDLNKENKESILNKNMPLQKTFDFEIGEHYIESTIDYDMVLDDYGVPGSPTFWSVDFGDWSDYTIDGVTMTDKEIVEKFGQDFKNVLDDTCDMLVNNADFTQ
jgi:hypothetical protein